MAREAVRNRDPRDIHRNLDIHRGALRVLRRVAKRLVALTPRPVD